MHGPPSARILTSFCVGLAAFMVSDRLALAGGFDIPDNGTEAVGRGAAFVAKSDDGTAIYHNPAGLARQRGTHALLNGNLYLHSFTFQRIGKYPDDPQDAETPWGNADFPPVSNTGGPAFSPFLAATSDFGTFDRLTFAAGVFSPPMIANRTFPLGVDGKPAASRYDFVQSSSSILMPTAAAGIRVTPWLDLGISAHLVLGSFNETSVAYAEVDKATCKIESFKCDSRNTLSATATSFGATLGALARPTPNIAVGATFRTPITLSAAGVVTPEKPRALEGDVQAGAATYALQLPYILRVGGRYIGMDGNFEVYDLELDVSYEGWGSAQQTGPITQIPSLGGDLKNIESIQLHGYASTFGARAGGAYNIDVGEGVLSVRAGALFDSAATDHAFTRLDHDTLAKVGGTLGLGFRTGSFKFDIGYAAIASLPRVVGSGVGQIRPTNLLKNGATVGADGEDLPVVNEGAYKGFTHILSVGASVSFETLFGPARPVHYGNAYEPGYSPPGEGPAPKKDEDRVDDRKAPDPIVVEEKKPPEPVVVEEKKPEPRKPDPVVEEKKPVVEEKKPPEPIVVEEPKPTPKKPEAKPPAPAPPPPAPPPVPVPKPVPEEKKPPPPPPPPPPEKPPTKRKEWWEES